MKIAIVSDSHDNLPNIDKMLAYCKQEKIKTMLHCGDVCAVAVLEYLGKNFNGQIYLILGNVSGEPDKMAAQAQATGIKYLGEEGEVKFGGKKIYLVHYPIKARQIAKAGRYDLVFYGHNHKPWEETIGKTRLVNPGTLAGLFQKATFAVYNTADDHLELIILERLN